MLKDKNIFSSFTTDNLEKSREFYEGILGLKVDMNEMGILEITAGKT
ncbi:MAG: VOC family protein [Fulvivirga sp.]